MRHTVSMRRLSRQSLVEFLRQPQAPGNTDTQSYQVNADTQSYQVNA
jgi:hypothetical protein